MSKIAVFFPGIGYRFDRPLLYFSRKLAANYGYEILYVEYTGFSADAKGSREGLTTAINEAFLYAKEILDAKEFAQYDDILFVSKSIGTAVASRYAYEKELKTKNIYYTPLHETFEYPMGDGIIFHGTCDQFEDTDVIKCLSGKAGLPLHILADGNHSLETGNVERDIVYLKAIMELSERYIAGL